MSSACVVVGLVMLIVLVKWSGLMKVTFCAANDVDVVGVARRRRFALALKDLQRQCRSSFFVESFLLPAAPLWLHLASYPSDLFR